MIKNIKKQVRRCCKTSYQNIFIFELASVLENKRKSRHLAHAKHSAPIGLSRLSKQISFAQILTTFELWLE